MSIVGVGIDVVDVDRFAAVLVRTPGVRDRLFTAAESTLATPSLAARFAAKEAVVKALRARLPWHEVEVRQDVGGVPRVVLTGAAARIAYERGVRAVHVSLSHERAIAAAVVVVET